MYATPSRDNAVVVSFETASSKGAPADRMKTAVKAVVDLSNASLGRTALDRIAVDEVWVERTQRSDVYTNEKVHVALSMPEDLRRAWYGLGSFHQSLEVGPGDRIPTDAFHWDRPSTDAVRLKRIEKIDKLIAVEAKPSDVHTVMAIAVLITSLTSAAFGGSDGAITMLATSLLLFVVARLKPDVDGTPTLGGAMHPRRHRLTFLIGLANGVGLVLPLMLAHLPPFDAMPSVAAGLLPITIVVSAAYGVARKSRSDLRAMRRQLETAGEMLTPAPDQARSVERSMDALLAVCGVLPDMERRDATIAASRCRIAASYSARGPAADAFDRSLDVLDEVLASHRRAAAYAADSDSVPLARRVHKALIAAGDEAENLRTALLAMEENALDTLGRYLDSRGSGGLGTIS